MTGGGNRHSRRKRQPVAAVCLSSRFPIRSHALPSRGPVAQPASSRASRQAAPEASQRLRSRETPPSPRASPIAAWENKPPYDASGWQPNARAKTCSRIEHPGFLPMRRARLKPFRTRLRQAECPAGAQRRKPACPTRCSTAIFCPLRTQPFVALENTCRHHRSQRLALRPAPARQSRPQAARGSRRAEPIRPGGDRRGTSRRLASAGRRHLAQPQEHERPVRQRLQCSRRDGHHPVQHGHAGPDRARLQRGRPAARRRCRLEGEEEAHPGPPRDAAQPDPRRNFELLLQAGATILPANPSFYTRPQTVEQVVDTVVARVLDHLGVAHHWCRGGQRKKE